MNFNLHLRNFAFMLIAFTLSAQTAKEPAPKPCDAPEAYEVYSAVLAHENPEGNLLIADTTVPFNSCLEPRHNRSIDSVIKNYKKVNRTPWRLQRNLNLGRDYKLVSADEIKAFQKPDLKGGFFWQFPDGIAITHLSAVGFNASRTIAFVELDFQCGGQCGHGRPYVLEKRDGQWQEYDDTGNWKYGKLKKNKDGTFEQTMRGPVMSICSWNY